MQELHKSLRAKVARKPVSKQKNIAGLCLGYGCGNESLADDNQWCTEQWDIVCDEVNAKHGRARV